MKEQGSSSTILMFSENLKYFFLNNQPDALIIQILFCYKTLHVSGIFSAHYQEFSCTFGTGKLHAGFDDRFQAQSGWNWIIPVPNVQ